MSNFKTPKGTQLELSMIKGLPYLKVPHRIMWFNEEREGWRIETNIVEHDADHSIVQAVIKDTNGIIVRTAYKQEDREGFRDHLEKAETGAIGRALGLLGYGTQFALELDEGEKVVDSPQQPKGSFEGLTNYAPQAPGKDYQITDKQAWFIMSQREKSSLSMQEFNSMIKMRFNKEDYKKLLKSEFDEMLKVIKEQTK